MSSPKTSAFLDDFEPNVVAARQLGMRGILVEHDISGALAELDTVIASG